jgi:hypothetical protein
VELETQIQRWCRDGIVTAAGGGMLDIVLRDGGQIRASIASTAPDEGELRATWAASGVAASMIGDLVRTAALLCSGLVRLEAQDAVVQISVPLFLDGLSRQSFLAAAADLGHAGEVLASSARALDDNRSSLEAAQRALAEADDLIAEGERARAELDAARASATGMELPPARWTATHIVPENGLSAWSTPDGSAAPAAMLAAGTELQALEQQGDWMLVAAANAWTGWVDARLLAPRT